MKNGSPTASRKDFCAAAKPFFAGFIFGNTEETIPHKRICPKTDRNFGKFSSGMTRIVLKEVRKIGSINRSKFWHRSTQSASRHCIKIESLLLIVAFFAGLVIAAPVITETIFRFDKEFLKKAEEKCGKEAPARFTAWEELIHKDKSPSDREKLEKVNHFYNSRIRFVSDLELWGVQDYWATPLEFLCKKAGDCEDFAIAKFFTLKAMGVAEEKLNIAYVKAIQYNIAHMVLTYYSEPGAEPLVLDNLIDSIDPASKRTDLMPIFSFNGSGLWTAKERGKGKLAGSADRLKPWQGLLQKMSQNEL